MKDIPEFKEKKELFDFLIENKSTLIAQKKAVTKHADGFSFLSVVKNEASKAEDNDISLSRKVIINTTNVLDSHRDVHFPGLWKKSLQENKNIMYLQEHEMKFSKVIADGADLKAYAKYYDWKDLGFDFEGKTQALEFDVTIKRDRNPFMFDQFKYGRVKQNSVGMRYVKMELAINDEDYGDEFEIWEKYHKQIVNLNENISYFWAVTEAKVIEGSAVLLGSNSFTPVLETKGAGECHSKEKPQDCTSIDYIYLSQNLKFQ